MIGVDSQAPRPWAREALGSSGSGSGSGNGSSTGGSGGHRRGRTGTRVRTYTVCSTDHHRAFYRRARLCWRGSRRRWWMVAAGGVC